MKRALLAILVLCISIGAILVSCTRSRRSKTVLSTGVSLSNQWLTLAPPSEFRSVGTVSEIFIAIPGTPTVSVDKGVTLENGNELRVEGYLTASDGERINLDQTWCRENTQTYVILMSPLLEWKEQTLRFRTLSLRSNVPTLTGEVVWLSDDPRHYKSGVLTPE